MIIGGPPGASIRSVGEPRREARAGGRVPDADALRKLTELKLDMGKTSRDGLLTIVLSGTDDVKGGPLERFTQRMSEDLESQGFGGNIMNIKIDIKVLQPLRQTPAGDYIFTFKGQNHRDFIEVTVKKTGSGSFAGAQIVDTKISLCPDNDDLTCPTLVQYQSGHWVYREVRGGLTVSEEPIAEYPEGQEIDRPLPESGLRIADRTAFEITGAFVPGTTHRGAGPSGAHPEAGPVAASALAAVSQPQTDAAAMRAARLLRLVGGQAQ